MERKDSLNNRIIGLNIKKYRKENHLTQERLAEALDISTVHMSHIEGGSVSMSLDLLLRICETLGASPNQILEGSYAPPSSPERTSSSELLQGGLSPELLRVSAVADEGAALPTRGCSWLRCGAVPAVPGMGAL